MHRWRCGKLGNMGRICSQCHAMLAEEAKVDWCPACGGALIEPTGGPDLGPNLGLNLGPDLGQPGAPELAVDHRGIVLPRRYALGGIITPR